MTSVVKKLDEHFLWVIFGPFLPKYNQRRIFLKILFDQLLIVTDP